ncbi:MAG: hypothetical protein Q9213_007064 [Squamulea squamosa]
MGDNLTASMREQYTQLQNIEFKRDQFVARFFDEREELQHRLQVVQEQRNREKEVATKFRAELDSVAKSRHRNAFVLALIDGDCMSFLDHLLRTLEVGGEKAAEVLRTAINHHIETSLPKLHALDVRLVVRIYLNVQDFGKTLFENGILEYSEDLNRFICSFNKKFPLFEIVNAGDDKECADVKLVENFKLSIRDVHCKQIIFGGSPDNGYARLLDT